MSRFATSARLAAWAGLAPGDNESAGKRTKAAARKGNQHLRAAMTESAWAAARTRSRPGARFRRLARRFGRGNEKKAAVAVAHTLLSIAWAVMTHDGDYTEADEDYYEQRDQRNHDHLARHDQLALARLGYQVTLIPPGDRNPPPGPGTPPAAPPGPGRLTATATTPASQNSRAPPALPRASWGPQVSSQASFQV